MIVSVIVSVDVLCPRFLLIHPIHMDVIATAAGERDSQARKSPQPDYRVPLKQRQKFHCHISYV
jgi:hypothetical protein